MQFDSAMRPLTLWMSMVHNSPCHMAAKHQRTCLTLRVSLEGSRAHPKRNSHSQVCRLSLIAPQLRSFSSRSSSCDAGVGTCQKRRVAGGPTEDRSHFVSWASDSFNLKADGTSKQEAGLIINRCKIGVKSLAESQFRVRILIALAWSRVHTSPAPSLTKHSGAVGVFPDFVSAVRLTPPRCC